MIGDEPPAYVPARSIETIRLQQILDAARAGADEPARHWTVRKLITDIERAVAGNLEGKILKDLVLADKLPPARAVAPELGSDELPAG